MKHTHKYLRYLTRKQKIPMYRCVKSGCTHNIEVSQALHRICVCWICGSDFVLDKQMIRRKRPRCNNCIRRESPEIENNLDTADDFLKSIKKEVVNER